jgi:triosephosphate isomerase
MTAARQPLMAGNWKMNLNHLDAIAHVQKLAFTLTEPDYEAVDVVVLPPFTAIRSVQTLVDGDRLRIRYGAQDLSANEDGAFTGEVSGSMLAKLGCAFATVGHSERRQYHAESNETVAAKAQAAWRHGITPIVCVGEPLEVRQAGTHVEYTLEQLRGSLAGADSTKVKEGVVAYEPVWAIGTGEVATGEDAQEMAAAIRTVIAELHGADAGKGLRILYGGSVKPDNVVSIMAQADVDGALVGGASLKPESFAELVRYREIGS